MSRQIEQTGVQLIVQARVNSYMQRQGWHVIYVEDESATSLSWATTTTPPASSNNSDVDMESLNAALHELGMLSAITQSRREYLRETIKTYSRSSTSSASSSSGAAVSMDTACRPIRQHNSVDSMSDGFCVLQMDSNYVTDLRLKVTCEFTGSESKWPPPRRHRRYIQKPYSVPSCAADARLRRRNWAVRSNLTLLDDDEHLSSTTTSSSSSKDFNVHLGGNRSSPGSPEKLSGRGGGLSHRSCCASSSSSRDYSATAAFVLPSQLPSSSSSSSSLSQLNSGGLLVRSRSLDDIETIQVVSTSSLHSMPSTRLDIDNVSARLGHLHVN